MQYKTDFGSKGPLTQSELKPGDLARCRYGILPFLVKDGGERVFFDGSVEIDPSPSQEVIRILIDRVDDGVPVFVDA